MPELKWSDWDAETHGFKIEPGVGLSLPIEGDVRWLSWDETIAFAAWLKENLDG